MITCKYLNVFLMHLFPWCIAIVLSSPAFGTGQSDNQDSISARLFLNYENHYALDVILPGDSSPACRLLLPEHIYGEGLKAIGKVHTYPAVWKESGNEFQGSLSLDQGVECGLWLKPTDGGVFMKISIKNTSVHIINYM